MTLIVDPDQLNQATEITITTATRLIRLFEAGNLSADGVTMQALYSFLKEEWKNDAALIPYPFPMVAITPEQFELSEGWSFHNDATRKLIRTGGWSEIDEDVVLQEQWTGIITLGSFEDDTNDTAYYQFGSNSTVDDTVNFTYAGPVNEAIKVYDSIGNPATCTFASTSTITRASGSFITDGFKVGGRVTVVNATNPANDGTYVLTTVAALTLTVSGTPLTASGADSAALLAYDNRNAVTLRIRVRDGDTNGKTYQQSTLTDIGVSVVDNKAFRFPLANATDLKIAESDANIAANSPYTQIGIKVFNGVYTKDVDGATGRNFGAVIDVGTHSGIDGSFTSGGSVLTSAAGGIVGATYAGGTITIHEGTDQNTTYPISGTPSGTQVTITGTFTDTESSISFTLQRATPVVATAEEIYEKIQYLLRQTSDIDSTGAVIIGREAPEFLVFVGDTLKTKRFINPNSLSNDGAIIEGFDPSDTNRLVFVDNLGTERTYPFVAAGTISFSQTLQDDVGPAKFWMFFSYTTRTAVPDLVLTTGTNKLTSAGSDLPALIVGDYININGLTGANESMNGIYEVTVVTSSTADYTVLRLDGTTITTTSSAAANVDQNPLNSPDAIIVDDNDGVDITGTISSPTDSFTFDYDGNVQGGRTAGTNAAITLRAIGLDTAQFVETTGSIIRATGQAYSLVSALERNYSNP